ncbi:MAG TPA: plastocyanin/azurin family copper-binding protein [Nitrospiria bacterium]|nr:plastocyanin/azurin family copper-binding protein [Nitrospiria bacterium]
MRNVVGGSLGVLIALTFLLVVPVKGEEGTVYEVTVIRNSFKLNPQDLTIKVGDTVKWTNTDERKHNLASIPGSGPGDELEIFAVMEPGAVYSHTFKVPGEYPYFCFIHNQMTGKITVEK